MGCIQPLISCTPIKVLQLLHVFVYGEGLTVIATVLNSWLWFNYPPTWLVPTCTSGCLRPMSPSHPVTFTLNKWIASLKLGTSVSNIAYCSVCVAIPEGWPMFTNLGVWETNPAIAQWMLFLPNFEQLACRCFFCSMEVCTQKIETAQQETPISESVSLKANGIWYLNIRNIWLQFWVEF